MVIWNEVELSAPLVEEVKGFTWLDSEVLTDFEDLADILLDSLLILEIAAGSDDGLVLDRKSGLLVLAGDFLLEVEILDGLNLKKLRVKLGSNLCLDEFNQAVRTLFLEFCLRLSGCEVRLRRWCNFSTFFGLWGASSEDTGGVGHVYVLVAVVNRAVKS